MSAEKIVAIYLFGTRPKSCGNPTPAVDAAVGVMRFFLARACSAAPTEFLYFQF